MTPKSFVIIVLAALVLVEVYSRPDPDCGANPGGGGGNPGGGGAGNPSGGKGGGGDGGGKGGGGDSGGKGDGNNNGGGKGGGGGGNLEVVISFDSLDTNSKNYFESQLKPIYDEMSKCVKWHFIPCSTSHIVQDVLQCKDGVDECKVDALHACAAHYYENDEQSLGKFFLCMMASGNQVKDGQKCASSSGLDWNKLKGCKPCNEAGQWCDNRWKQLNAYHEPNIPGVLFDKKYNAQSESKAMSDLKGAICEKLKEKNSPCAACDGCSGGGSPGGGSPSGGPGGKGGGGGSGGGGPPSGGSGGKGGGGGSGGGGPPSGGSGGKGDCGGSGGGGPPSGGSSGSGSGNSPGGGSDGGSSPGGGSPAGGGSGTPVNTSAHNLPPTYNDGNPHPM